MRLRLARKERFADSTSLACKGSCSAPLCALLGLSNRCLGIKGSLSELLLDLDALGYSFASRARISIGSRTCSQGYTPTVEFFAELPPGLNSFFVQLMRS